MGVASDRYAELTRQNYEDWLRRFYPSQQRLLKDSQNDVLLNEQLSRVGGVAKRAMGGAALADSNRMARYGVVSDNDPSRKSKQALAIAHAKNSLREHERDRSLRALSGGTTGLRQYSDHQTGR